MNKTMQKWLSVIIYPLDVLLLIFLSSRIGDVLKLYWEEGEEVWFRQFEGAEIVGFGIAALFLFVVWLGCFEMLSKPNEEAFGSWLSTLNVFQILVVVAAFVIPLVEVGLVAMMFEASKTGAFAAINPVERSFAEIVAAYGVGIAFGLGTFVCAWLTAQSMRLWSHELDKRELARHEAAVNDNSEGEDT